MSALTMHDQDVVDPKTNPCSESSTNVLEDAEINSITASEAIKPEKCDEVASGNEDSMYTCGACATHFSLICKLHEHLKSHNEGGSYFFDHQTHTAYPRFVHLCNSTQTDPLAECEQLKVKRKVNKFDSLSSLRAPRKSVKRKVIKARSYKRRGNSVRLLPLDSADTRNDLSVEVSEDGSAKGKSISKPRRRGRPRKDLIKCEPESPCEDNVSRMVCDAEDIPVVHDNVDDSDVYTHAADQEEMDVHLHNDNLSQDGLEKEECVALELSVKVEDEDYDYDYSDNDDFHDDDNYEDDSESTNGESQNEVKKKRGRKPKPRTDSDDEKDNKKKILSSQKKFICEICEKRYTTDAALQYHRVKFHLDVYSYIVEQSKQCRYCGESFEKKRDVKAHLKECEKNDSLRCCVCDMKFPSFLELREHLATHKSPEELQCKTCGKICSSAQAMRIHIRRHTLVKNIQCDKCGKAFFYHNLLIKHLVYCTGMRSIDCPKCDLKFKTKEALKHHSTVHMEEKPFVCHICGYAGKKLMYLKRHIRTHTGEKPYQCKECGMSFAALNGLNRHNKIHTNTKNCVCSFCGKSFTNNWNLKTHIRQHTGDTPYKCIHCGQGFKQNVLVKLHMRSHHPFE